MRAGSSIIGVISGGIIDKGNFSEFKNTRQTAA
jgi:hypothetical protein